MTETDEVPYADAALVAGESPPSARTPLDRDRIITAAIEFIDDQGVPGLTMRRLGDRLEVEAMSLYRYVPGKEDLLDAVVDTLVLSLEEDSEVLSAPTDGWQDFLQRLAHGVRRVALAHPKAFPLVASRPPEAPWLRPPLRSIAWVEAFLDGADHRGLHRRGRGRPATAPSRASCSVTCCWRCRRWEPTSALSTSSMTGRPTTPASRTSRRCAVCVTRCPRTTRPWSSRSPWRTCWTGWA